MEVLGSETSAGEVASRLDGMTFPFCTIGALDDDSCVVLFVDGKDSPHSLSAILNPDDWVGLRIEDLAAFFAREMAELMIEEPVGVVADVGVGAFA